MSQILRRRAVYEGEHYELERADGSPLWAVRKGREGHRKTVGTLVRTVNAELPERLRALEPSEDYPEAKLLAIYAASELVPVPTK